MSETLPACGRLQDEANIRCGRDAMAVLHLARNGVQYLAYVCDIHYQEAAALEAVAP